MYYKYDPRPFNYIFHMSPTLLYAKKIIALLQRLPKLWLIVTLIFLLVSWLHMGSSLSQCRNVVLSEPGDHTSGMIYQGWLQPLNPVLGGSQLTNYPYGENLYQPTSLSTIVSSTSHLALSQIAGPVCGWNLLILSGYMSTALIMFGFVRWLTKNNYVAFFAGYAITFTPYHAFASWGQPAGLYSALFILAFWLFALLWRKPSAIRATMLGLVLGVSFYTDGYFILFSGVCLLTFFSAYFIVAIKLRHKRTRSSLRPRIRYLMLVAVIALLFLLPLAWINLHYADKISNYFGAARGNIAYDAQTYSARPHMYLTPPTQSPLIGSKVEKIQEQVFDDTSKPGLVFLGYSIVGLAIYTSWLLWTKRRTAEWSVERFDGLAFIAFTSLLLVFFALWISLRPRSYIGNFPVPNPSMLVIKLTSAWRVFGRLYMLVSIGAVTMAAVGLASLMTRFSGWKRILVFTGLFILMTLELRSFPASTVTTTFNYKDAPMVYEWLSTQSNVRAIAEYPLDEIPQGSYLGDYYTFQQISGKPILNSILPNSPNASLRRSIAGINDPQTLPVLRALGIDVVNIRPLNPDNNSLPDARYAARNNSELERVFSHESQHPMDSFLVKPGYTAKHALTISPLHYYQLKYTTAGSVEYLMGSGTTFSVIELPGNTEGPRTITASFVVRADSKKNSAILQDGRVLWSGIIEGAPKQLILQVRSDKPFTIYCEDGSTQTQLYISELQIVQ